MARAISKTISSTHFYRVRVCPSLQAKKLRRLHSNQNMVEKINKVSNAIIKNGIIIRRPPPFQPTPVPSSASLPVLQAPRPQDSPTSAMQSPSRDGDSAQRPSHARSVSVCTCYCKNILQYTHDSPLFLLACLLACRDDAADASSARVVWRRA